MIADAAAALDGVPDPDLTVELITHRFTPGSKAVLDSWYPGSALEMDPEQRTEKRTKFGSIKHVYDHDTMKTLAPLLRGGDRVEVAARPHSLLDLTDALRSDILNRFRVATDLPRAA